MSRRHLLGLALLVALAGCAQPPPPPPGTTALPPAPVVAATGLQLGFIVPTLDDSVIAAQIARAQEVATAKGFELVPLVADDEATLRGALATLAGRGAKGAVVELNARLPGTDLLAEARKLDLKLIALGQPLVDAAGQPLAGVPWNGPNESTVGGTAGKMLTDRYHLQGWDPATTGAIALSSDAPESAERLAAARFGLLDGGFPSDRLFEAAADDAAGGAAAMTTLASSHGEVRTWLVYADRDTAAIGAVRTLEARGLGNEEIRAVAVGGEPGLAELGRPADSGFVAVVLPTPPSAAAEAMTDLEHWVTAAGRPAAQRLHSGLLVTRDARDEIMRAEGLLPEPAPPAPPASADSKTP